jgi:hypothetical protein
MLKGSVIERMHVGCNVQAKSIGRVEISGMGSGFAHQTSGSRTGGIFAADQVDYFYVLDGARIVNNSHVDSLGAVLNTQTLGNLLIRNATVTGNQASKSGAFYVKQSISGSVRLVNSAVVAGNVALAGSGGFLFVGGNVQVW